MTKNGVQIEGKDRLWVKDSKKWQQATQLEIGTELHRKPDSRYHEVAEPLLSVPDGKLETVIKAVARRQRMRRL